MKKIGIAIVLATWMLSGVAHAGDYLDRAGLLVHTAREEIDYLQHRRTSKDLSALVHRMANARLTAAREGFVPKEVVQAHPHLLLLLEDCERAADAAELRDDNRFFVYLKRARDEEQIFRTIMRSLGFPLEDESKKAR
jgi:hypothetical protein